MGCDIHFYVEKKNPEGKWESADTWKREYGMLDVPNEKAFYDGRNYDLFGMLADVRNGTHGEEYTPISNDLKGVPADASAGYKKAGEDGHSHTWYLLSELLAYDWEGQTVKHAGWSDYSTWLEWVEKGKLGGGPRMYSQSVDGPVVVKLAEEGAEDVRRSGRSVEDWFPGKSVYVKAVWENTYSNDAGFFYTNTLPRLKELAGNDPESVRCLFFFDS